MSGYSHQMARAGAKKSYHHGDLRDALLAAAERLMVEQANWTFTLREVARVAGVSHNAPYNHFPDRRALLAAVAARGFDDLTVALRESLADIDPTDVPAGIRATARAYVAFAVTYPSRYRLMFSADLAGCEDPVFKVSGAQAFAVLLDLIKSGVSEGHLCADPLGTHALAAWSLVHGLATLLLDGRVQVQANDRDLTASIDAIAGALVEGLVLGRR